jgi:two-component system, OmpR family, sensor kinase
VRSTPLFLQAMGLTLATLIAGLIATTVVVLLLPPPRPDIYTLAEVARVFQTGRPTPSRDGQTIEIAHKAAPPQTVALGRRHLRFRTGLAQILGLSPDDILVIQKERRLIAFSSGDHMRQAPALTRDQPLLIGQFQVWVRQPGAGWLVATPNDPLIDPWQWPVLYALGLAAIAVTPLAWIFSRRIAAPIAALAVAAERLGRDPDAPPLNIRGSSEVAAAAAAFNEMQKRLKRYVEYRTSMVASIAHDLRTPLMRLRFRIEAAPEDLRTKLGSEIDTMEAMVAATLAFVRDAAGSIDRTALELASLVETVVEDASETGADAAVDHADRVVVQGDPVALKRLVTNLVDNALKFGSRARCRVYAERGHAILEVDDDGPGVPESEVERAFEPFHRLENSRSRETGGSGLGLAVVRAIARGHGGEVTLQNRPGGGLRARLSLPAASRVGVLVAPAI